MSRNLIVLFDGTWNKRRTGTNVIRLRDSIRTTGRDDAQQPCFYDEGVGTKWWNRLSGGAFGRGLSENIQEGYAWLSRHHAPGDAIYIPPLWWHHVESLGQFNVLVNYWYRTGPDTAAAGRAVLRATARETLMTAHS